MRTFSPFSVLILVYLSTLGASQSTFPDADDNISEKFSIGVAGPISTPEGSAFSASAEILDASQFSAGISGQNNGFIKASGTQFYLSGAPWFCAGSNAYYAALKYIMSDAEVKVMMKEHAAKGANVLRVFAHNNFGSSPEPMMIDFGVYSEDAIRRLDLALVEAGKNGIRLILVMANYWSFLGGMQAWVDKGLGYGKSYTLFYTDATMQQYYKDWLYKIVTRTNSITGVKYTDDPTIMAYELANEPRVGDNYERNNNLKPGQIVCDWVYLMSSYIKSLDSNHMVTVGDEGMRTDGSLEEPHSWLNNGYEGVDFVCNLAAPSVDFGTVHAYPDSWGIGPNEYNWLDKNYFQDRASIAKSLSKPLILEEYGMRAEGYLSSREPLFDFFHDSVNAAGYACTLVWAASHYSTDPGTSGTLFGFNDGAGYVFAYDKDGSVSVLKQYQYMAQKNEKSQSSPSPSPPPVVVLTPPPPPPPSPKAGSPSPTPPPPFESKSPPPSPSPDVPSPPLSPPPFESKSPPPSPDVPSPSPDVPSPPLSPPPFKSKSPPSSPDVPSPSPDVPSPPLSPPPSNSPPPNSPLPQSSPPPPVVQMSPPSAMPPPQPIPSPSSPPPAVQMSPPSAMPPPQPIPSPPPSPSTSPSSPSPPPPGDITYCVDVLPPGTSATCQQMRARDQCYAGWMNGYCRVTCGTCP